MAMSDREILHTSWDCLWSWPGRHLAGVSEDLQPEPTRVCVRDGGRCPVSDDDCARCARWEPLPAGVYAAGAPQVLGPIAAIEALPRVRRGIVRRAGTFFPFLRRS